jgi:hypothetical protein
MTIVEELDHLHGLSVTIQREKIEENDSEKLSKALQTLHDAIENCVQHSEKGIYGIKNDLQYLAQSIITRDDIDGIKQDVAHHARSIGERLG